MAWVFFRADSLSDALYIVPRMFIPTVRIFHDGSLLRLGLSAPQLVVAAIAAVVVLIAEHASFEMPLLDLLNRHPLPIRWAVYLGVVLAIVIFGRYGSAYSAATFVYFKF